jgi:NADH-quinone oxidoreductase subunit J
MLLDLRTEEAHRINWLTSAAGLAVALILLGQILSVIGHLKIAHTTFPTLPGTNIDDVRNVGAALFTNYNLPFQIVGVLVLVATIGVVLLSKREPR